LQPRIPLQNSKVPHGKLNVAAGKLSPILSGYQRPILEDLLDNFASAATSSIKRQRK
jgi:hypothetical protein